MMFTSHLVYDNLLNLHSRTIQSQAFSDAALQQSRNYFTASIGQLAVCHAPNWHRGGRVKLRACAWPGLAALCQDLAATSIRTIWAQAEPPNPLLDCHNLTWRVPIGFTARNNEDKLDSSHAKRINTCNEYFERIPKKNKEDLK